MAIILGNSAVVNSSSKQLPAGEQLDAMRLNWGPYLWMRCYNNGAQFLDEVVGTSPDWKALEAQARPLSPGCGGTAVIPFTRPEPSLGIDASMTGLRWCQAEAPRRAPNIGPLWRVPSLFLLAVPTALAATATSLHALILWRFAQGLFVPGVIAVMLAYINEEWAGRGVGRAMSSYVTGTVIGGSLGTLHLRSHRDALALASHIPSCSPH